MYWDTLTLLHSVRPKLSRVLAILSAIGLKGKQQFQGKQLCYFQFYLPSQWGVNSKRNLLYKEQILSFKRRSRFVSTSREAMKKDKSCLSLKKNGGNKCQCTHTLKPIPVSYHISSAIRCSLFLPKQSQKYLGPSYKMDLDLRDC